MKIIGYGYRDWALEIFNNIREIPDEMYVMSSKRTVKYDIIETINPDMVLFYGWSWMVPQEIVDKYTCLCLHPSPLPLYRGGSPIQHQILAGEMSSAVTIFKMGKGMDDGPVYIQKDISLDGDILDIYQRITETGTLLTEEIINYLPFPWDQDESKATTFRRRKPKESEITPEELSTLSASKLHDKVRMLTGPYPTAFITCADGSKLYLHKTSVEDV